MAALHAFDTLAYVKALIDRGYERDKAEALAEAQREFFVKELASEDFVRNEVEKAVLKLDSKIEREITDSENRMMKANAKLVAFAVGIILAGIPLIQALLQKLLS